MPDGDRGAMDNLRDQIEVCARKMFDITEEMETITATARAEARELNDEERKHFDQLTIDFDTAQADKKRLDGFQNRLIAVVDIEQPVGRQSDPDDVVNSADGPPNGGRSPNGGRPRVPATSKPANERGSWGWRSFGEFARGVRVAAAKGGSMDPRLVQNAPTSWGSESVGEDGGFAVPPEYKSAIMQMVMGEESLLSRTDQQVSSSNSWVMPTDETTPWQTSGGIQAYWEAEASQIAQSKPSFGNNTLRLHKLAALVGVTEELREDAASLDRYLRSKAPEKINYKVADAVIRGTGAGMPLGILNSPCLVTAAAEASQAADTVRAHNITSMWSRLYAPYRAGAVWLINQDLEAQLPLMGSLITTPDGTTAAGGAGMVYMPPGGLSGAQYGTIYGRPVIPHEACSGIGDVGDIILASLGQYVSVTKTGGIRAEVSMHLWFDYDMSAYKFVLRLAGAPWLSAPIARANSANTLSSFVTLAAR